MAYAHTNSEFIALLNELAWESTSIYMVAKFDTDDISTFKRLIAFELGVSFEIVDLPDGRYEVVFYKKSLPRFKELGLRFPGQGEFSPNFGPQRSSGGAHVVGCHERLKTGSLHKYGPRSESVSAFFDGF